MVSDTHEWPLPLAIHKIPWGKPRAGSNPAPGTGLTPGPGQGAFVWDCLVGTPYNCSARLAVRWKAPQEARLDRAGEREWPQSVVESGTDSLQVLQ